MIRGWNGETFYAERNNLADLVEQETDLVRKDYLQMVLETTEHVYNRRFTSYAAPRLTEREALDSVAASVVSANRYFCVAARYVDSLPNVLKKSDFVNHELNRIMGKKSNLSMLGAAPMTPDKAISILVDFYKRTDSELYDLFQRAMDSSYLDFLDKYTTYLTEDTDGKTFFIDGVEKNFIAIMNSRDIKLVSNLVHEYGHAMKNLVAPEAAYTNEYDYFAEVPSIFMELLSYEENVGEYPKIVMDFLRYDVFAEYFNYACQLSSQPYIYLQWRNNGFNINRKMKRKLLKEDGINKEIYDKALNSDISENGSYLLSYIVSLELLHIYREDKREALKLFKKLLQLKPSVTYLGEVQKIVKLNEFALQESEKVVDDITLSLKRRG